LSALAAPVVVLAALAAMPAELMPGELVRIARAGPGDASELVLDDSLQPTRAADAPWHSLSPPSPAPAEPLAQRLIEAYRRLHLALPVRDREEFVAGLLRDSLPLARAMGFELVQRELSEGAAPGEKIAQAALAILRDEDPSVRARAAGLIRQLAPPDAPTALQAALAREVDPRAAGAMLVAAQRFRVPAMVEPALRWSMRDGPAQEPGVELLADLVRAGDVWTQDDEERVLVVARSVSESSISPGVVLLRSQLGDATDRERTESWLRHPRLDVRQAAARALIFESASLAPLVDASRASPELFDAAVTALLVHAPTAESFRVALSLAPPPEPTRTEGLLRLARSLPALELSSVWRDAPDASLRRQLLAELATPERRMSEGVVPEASVAISMGAWELSGLLLDDAQPDRAIAALDLAPDLARVVGERALADRRCECLVAFGRLDLAMQVDASPDAWLRGAEVAVRTARPHAGDLLSMIEERFGSALSGELASRLAALRAKLAPAPR
jgi:hypothetical protein